MSILIKGKTIPQGCGDCLLLARCVTYSDYCKVLDVDIDVVNSTYKHPNCPLVEVKEPHGRLIDADALDTRVRQAGGMGNVEEECTEDFNDGVLFVLDYFVKNAPTVIPREDGENHEP